MAIKLGDAIWEIRGDITKLNKSMGDAEARIQKSLGNVLKKGRSFGIGMTVAGGAIVGALGLATKEAASFGTAMAEVATLGVEDLDTITQGVKDISVEFGTNLVETATGAYQAISATGADAAEATQILATATKAAVAGVSEVSAAVELGTGTMNAFGKETSDLESIFDEAFIAVKSGVTTFEELASSTGKLAPIFSAAGLSSGEMFAALATLTKSGISTKEAVTGLKAAMTNLIKPSKDAVDLTEQLSQKYEDFEFSVSRLQEVGLQQFMEDVQEATGGNIEQMSKLFGSVEGLNTMLALTSEAGGAEFKAILEDIKNGTGAMDEAFKTFVENNPAFALEQLNSQLTVMKVEIGTALLPVLAKLADFMKPVIEWISAWIEENPGWTKAIVTVTGVLGALLLVLGPLLIMLPGIIALFTSPLVAAFAAVIAPIVLLVVKLGLVVFAFIKVKDAITEAIRMLNEWRLASNASAEADAAQEKLKRIRETRGEEQRFQTQINGMIRRLKALRAGNEEEVAAAKAQGKTILEREQWLLDQILDLRTKRGEEVVRIVVKQQKKITDETEKGSAAVLASTESNAEVLTTITERVADATKEFSKEKIEAEADWIAKVKEFVKQAIAEYRQLATTINTKMDDIIKAMTNVNTVIGAAMTTMIGHFTRAKLGVIREMDEMLANVEARVGQMADAIAGIGSASGAPAPAPVSGNGPPVGASTRPALPSAFGSGGLTLHVTVSGGSVGDATSLGETIGEHVLGNLRASGVML